MYTFRIENFFFLQTTFSPSRDSSVGRASDWRSEGPWFDPGSRHVCFASNLHTYRSKRERFNSNFSRFPFIGKKGWKLCNLSFESITFMKICIIYGLFILYANRTKGEQPISIRNYMRHLYGAKGKRPHSILIINSLKSIYSGLWIWQLNCLPIGK